MYKNIYKNEKIEKNQTYLWLFYILPFQFSTFLFPILAGDLLFVDLLCFFDTFFLVTVTLALIGVFIFLLALIATWRMFIKGSDRR